MQHGHEPAGKDFSLGNKRRKASDPSVGPSAVAQNFLKSNGPGSHFVA